MNLMEEAITHYWGHRCVEYDGHCPCCRAWAEYDKAINERNRITKWLRALDQESGDINRFLPTTLANWIEERMHEL